MCIDTRWSGGMEGIDDGDSQQVAANDYTSPMQVCEQHSLTVLERREDEGRLAVKIFIII